MRFVLLLLAFGAAAGCQSAERDDARTLPLQPDFASAPDAVRRRAALPSCGFDPVERPNPEARRCFLMAYRKGSAVEVLTSRYTIEGDLMFNIYRSLGDGTVEIFVDHTRDEWSRRKWLHLACPGVSVTDLSPDLDIPGGCTETELVED